MVIRIVLTVIAVLLVANGAFMLIAPASWYGNVDGVPATGPLNVHFVRDIGFAYLAAGVGTLLGAWRAAWILPGGLPALTFLGGHALMHLWEAVAGHGVPSLAEAAGVHAPAVLLLLILLTTMRRRASQRG